MSRNGRLTLKSRKKKTGPDVERQLNKKAERMWETVSISGYMLYYYYLFVFILKGGRAIL